MYEDDLNASPVNPLPPVIIAFSLVIAGIELIMQAAERGILGGSQGVGWRLEAITSYGFFDSVFNWLIETGNLPLEHTIRFVTYLGIHGSFTHALFVIVFILAIGKMVAEVFSTLSFVVIFFASGIVGALAYAVFIDGNVPLVGAYPAVYGLIGAMTFTLWVVARVTGENQYRAFGLIGFLLGIQLLFKLLFGGGDDWVADIAGFATGFLASFVLAPNGASRVAEAISRIRRRR